MIALECVLWSLIVIIGVPAILASTYFLTLTLLSWRIKVPPTSSPDLNFDVIVPAHNEAGGIARTVKSLAELSWPRDKFRVVVVADNCSDDTAAIAAANGAHVIERRDERLRGKGYALSYAFDMSRREQWAQAVVVVDADSKASANLLSAIASRINAGAHAVQTHYDVLNPNDSWRTKLITIAMGAFHVVRSRARERLSLSCGIRGNGWCVTHSLLSRLPYRAFSLTEDVEYGIDLGINGYRVHYCDEAHVYGEMVTSSGSAGTQRQRWEQGRFKLIRERSLPLLHLSYSKPSRICLDLALDLLVLPLTYVGVNIAALAAVSTLAGLVDTNMYVGLWAAAACALSVALYFLRGWQLSGTGWSGLLTLLWVPVFVAWKLLVILTGRRSSEWKRTEREQQ
jgi:1,2-diacylglycerol 3-beta-glucosyltransferase